MSVAPFLGRLARARQGAATVELAVLAPAFMALFFGVFQVGMAMQNYNALRGISADVARYALVQYSTGNKLSKEQLNSYALSVGRSAPYILDSGLYSASITQPAVQRVTGVTEFELTLRYQVFSVMHAYGLRGPYITFRRPIFVKP
ncbi:pilus assembly protein [Tsuneonella sp. YG55]|uniref:Pilus assembly protein n=1 Tax=Tsuneonella litorea TaxID=2976475 RepID=A0A9X2W004_9SPHN|nr:TadE/TadG family type IV pilus assembly protein [Tsuneonella litorea]MCT2557999.1 pilus assembly protein [Tsuneonella litorea]